MSTVIAREGALGSLVWSGGAVGSVVGDTVTITPDRIVTWPVPQYDRALLSAGAPGLGIPTKYRLVLSGIDKIQTLMRAPAGTTVKVRYRVAGGEQSAQETVTVNSLELDLTKGFGEQVTQGSVRFTLGNSTYVNTAGAIYRDPSPETGAGSIAGTLDPIVGRVLITSWLAGGANAVNVQSLVTEVGGQPIDDITFRTPISPIKAGTLQLRFVDIEGNVYTKTPDTTGLLEDADCSIRVDFDRGIVEARFGRWREASTLTPEELAAPWYSPDSIVDIGGTDHIWRPLLVMADSILYNTVASTLLPPDSDLLGLDAARLPPDGKALIYQTGMLALVHHTDSLAKGTLVAGEEIDCGRTRLYRVVIEDSAGARFPADLYTVNRELGIVTMITPLDVSAYTAPFFIKHTVADLARVRDTDINGTVTFLRPVTHTYPADDSYLSGMLYLGTLQARVSDVFEQTTWTGVWSDSRIGDQPLASYNAAQFPIQVTNAGAYKDRMLVKFTSATAFQVIGENLGLVAIGDINNDCSPINPLTGEAYFTIDYRGWGGGWATGNCLRFNLHAASYPVDLVRAVQPSDPTGQSDCVELLLVGNTDQ